MDSIIEGERIPGVYSVKLWRDNLCGGKEDLSFLQYPDGMVISYEIKHIKPEREIYEALIERFHIIPEQALFIDDLAVNIEAAQKMGFQTILFTSKKEVEQVLNGLPVIS